MANQAGKEDNQPSTFRIIRAADQREIDIRTAIKYDIKARQYAVRNNDITNVLLRPGHYILEEIQFGGKSLDDRDERVVTSFPAVNSLNVEGESKNPHSIMRLITIPNDGSYIKVADSRGNGEAYKIITISESVTQGDGFVVGGRKSKRKTRKRRRKSRKKKRTRRRKRKTKSLFKKKRTKKRGYGGKSPKRRK